MSKFVVQIRVWLFVERCLNLYKRKSKRAERAGDKITDVLCKIAEFGNSQKTWILRFRSVWKLKECWSRAKSIENIIPMLLVVLEPSETVENRLPNRFWWTDWFVMIPTVFIKDPKRGSLGYLFCIRPEKRHYPPLLAAGTPTRLWCQQGLLPS